MKRFLLLTLGVALLAAAPISAQTDSGGAAAELLAKAQAAAAAGEMQRAAELAQAAAQLIAAQQAASPTEIHERVRAHLMETARTEAARTEAAHASAEGGDAPTASLPARVRWLQQNGDPAEAHGFAFAAPAMPGAPHAAPAQEPAPDGGAVIVRRRGPDAPRAQEDELGLTMKLIHAEVQALRAEVQALRAEMALQRAHGGAGRAAAPAAEPRGRAMFRGPARMELLQFHGDGGEWHAAAPEATHEWLFVGPDGRRIELDAFDSDWRQAGDADGFEIELEDAAESLEDLGYIGDADEQPARRRLLLRAVPHLEDVVIREVPAAPATPSTPATPSRPDRPDRPRR